MNTQQAGLGAAFGAPQQKGQDLSNMTAMMDMLKNVPDQTLADVLAGKPVTLDVHGSPIQVPQFAAMLAAQGRQELRTAMAGQQAQQPSIKDQLLSAEQQAAHPQQMIVPPQAMGQQPMGQPSAQNAPAPQAGLDQIPAPNMQSMRAGGITGEEDVPRYSGEDGNQVTQGPFQKAGYKPYSKGVPFRDEDPYTAEDARRDISSLPSRIAKPFVNWYNERQNALNKTLSTAAAQNWGDNETADPSKALPPNTYAPPLITQSSNAGTSNAGLDAALKNKAPSTVPLTAPLTAPVTNPNAKLPPGSMPPADVMDQMRNDDMYNSINSTISDLQNKHSKFQDMLDAHAKAEPERKKEIEDVRNQGIGQYMMNMGAALLANPQFGKAVQEGNTSGLAALNLSRKEAKELQKDYRDYNFNLQKAAVAEEQGNQELVEKYQGLTQKFQNDIGTLAVHKRLAAVAEEKAPAEISELKARANYYNEMPGVMAAKGVGANAKMSQITIQQAITDFKGLDPKTKRELEPFGVTNAMTYQQYINSGGQPLTYSTIDKNAVVRQ